MFIKRLQMLNYRNYNVLDISLGPHVNVFMGDNAQGKTNILEGIYYCAFARSHRTSKDRELINWNADNALLSVSVGRERLDKRIDISILKDGKKAIQINKIKIKKIGELFGNFNVVMFSPEDLKIIKDSPGVRRKFIDMELCQLNPKYYYNLVQYNKVLNERNSILRNKNISKDILENWNLLFEKKKKKHENLREIWFSGYFSLILNSLQYDLKNKEEWKLSFLNYEKILEKDMYAWYEKTTHMCCAFFYDITQIFYIVLAGQEKQIIEADESVTQSIRKIQLFIRRHEDYWKDHVKQKIELEHRLEAML